VSDAAARAGLHIVADAAPGVPLPATSYARGAYGNTQPAPEKARWLTVRPDGTVVAYAGKVEYGQGIRTGLAIEVADELRVPLDTVEVVLGDTDLVPWDMGTFGSQSTARVGLQLRKAAATARQALLNLAADRLDLPAGDLRASGGRIGPMSDGSRSISYADLLRDLTVTHDLDDGVALTPPGEFSVMGRPQHRVDAVARPPTRNRTACSSHTPCSLVAVSKHARRS
jgi:isoquinoline 1-oxidoreductase